MHSLCKCGCGRKARRTWHSNSCREAWRSLQTTPERREYALQRIERAQRLAAAPTHEAMATVHHLNDDDDHVEIKQYVVTIPIVRLGIFGL